MWKDRKLGVTGLTIMIAYLLGLPVLAFTFADAIQAFRLPAGVVAFIESLPKPVALAIVASPVYLWTIVGGLIAKVAFLDIAVRPPVVTRLRDILLIELIITLPITLIAVGLSPVFSLLSDNPLLALAVWTTIAFACAEGALRWKILALFPDARRTSLFLAVLLPTLFTILMSGFLATASMFLGV
ncbi:hypothetical protein RJ527_09270 [Thalassospiraceae bacterium LMO-SO8]|nr:hypothetical protein [Alphaproteobacteria bacterium LMO-S08]WND77922.1 hypothetical protein RJ527_09270 [Thalassospiraceae bacterium LMO-SO8]